MFVYGWFNLSFCCLGVILTFWSHDFNQRGEANGYGNGKKAFIVPEHLTGHLNLNLYIHDCKYFCNVEEKKWLN